MQSNIHEIQHPLLAHKLTLLQDKHTPEHQFRELLHEISLMLVYEATEHLPTKKVAVETPMETFDSPVLDCKMPVIAPILRAGLGMVPALQMYFPRAHVGHIGLYRDETTMAPKQYYFRIPPHSEDRIYYLCDPMLATGGSAIAAVNLLKEQGIKHIVFICILAAPEGLKALLKIHPDITLYTASIDRQLDENAFILPGLGDAGDRFNGTVDID